MKVEELREIVEEIEEEIGIEIFINVVEEENVKKEEIAEKIERCERLKNEYIQKTAKLRCEDCGENSTYDRIEADLIKEIEKLRNMKVERAALEKKIIAEKIERAALRKENVPEKKAGATAVAASARRKAEEKAGVEKVKAEENANVAKRAASEEKTVIVKKVKAEANAIVAERAALENENVAEKMERAALEENVAKKMERAALENENLAEKKAGVTAVATSANKEEIAIAEKKNKAEGAVSDAAAGAREIVKKDSVESKAYIEKIEEVKNKAEGANAVAAGAKKKDEEIKKKVDSGKISTKESNEKEIDEEIGRAAREENVEKRKAEEETATKAKVQDRGTKEGSDDDSDDNEENDDDVKRDERQENEDNERVEKGDEMKNESKFDNENYDKDDVKNDDNANDEKYDEGSDDEEEEKTAKAVGNEDESSDDESAEDEDEDDMKDKEEMLVDEAMKTEKPSDEKNKEEEDPSYFERAWKMLEMARNIYNIPTNIRKLCNTLLALGEVSIENENYAQAEEDLNSCPEKRKDKLPNGMREIAEMRYQLEVALSYQDQHTEAFKHFNDAINILENVLQTLKVDTFDARVGKIDELELLLPEIANRSFQLEPFFVMDEIDAALDNTVELHSETKLPRQFDPGINGDWSCSGLNLDPAVGSEGLVSNYVEAAAGACTVVERWRNLME